MIRGSARLRALHDRARPRGGAARRGLDAHARTHGRRRAPDAPAARDRRGRCSRVLVLFGSRSLLVGHGPAGRVVPGLAGRRRRRGRRSPASWRTTFMGAARPATPAFALMAALERAALRSPGPGAVARRRRRAAARRVRRVPACCARSRRRSLPGVAAAAAYAANPIARNAIWQGELGPLVCFALAPFVLRRVRAARPRRRREPTRRRAVARRVHALCALLVAVAGSVWPPALLLAPAVRARVLHRAPVRRRRAHGAARARGATVVATVAGVLLLAPWSFSLFGADAATFGAQPRASLVVRARCCTSTPDAPAPGSRRGASSPPRSFRSRSRPARASRGRRGRGCSPRCRSRSRGCRAGSRAGATMLAPDGVLVAAAIALAFAAGLGVAAVLDDLRRFHFGWRQVMMIVAFAGLALAVLGFAADTLSGRFGLRADDWPTDVLVDDRQPARRAGSACCGSAIRTCCPPTPRSSGDIGFALTRDGPGDARASWAAPEQHADRVLARHARRRRVGLDGAPRSSGRAGRRALHRVRPAGRPDERRVRPRPRRALSDALARQLDLTLSRVDDVGVVYDNDAWIPMHAVVPPGEHDVRRRRHRSAGRRGPVGAGRRDRRAGDRRATTGAVGPGTLLWSEAASPHWNATANGDRVARRTRSGGRTRSRSTRTRRCTCTTPGAALVSARCASSRSCSGSSSLALWFATRRRRPSRRGPPAAPVVAEPTGGRA